MDDVRILFDAVAHLNPVILTGCPPGDWAEPQKLAWDGLAGLVTAIIAFMFAAPLVGVVMGSRNDFAVMKAAAEILSEFGVAHEVRVVSAHRTPDLMFEYAEQAGPRGLRMIIAGAGGAAHLPGMLAAKTIVPVLGVPIAATALQGMDSLLSIVQMPKGVPVATFAIGAPGAANAALFAIAMLAAGDAGLVDEKLGERLSAWRRSRRDEVLAQTVGLQTAGAAGDGL